LCRPRTTDRPRATYAVAARGASRCSIMPRGSSQHCGRRRPAGRSGRAATPEDAVGDAMARPPAADTMLVARDHSVTRGLEARSCALCIDTQALPPLWRETERGRPDQRGRQHGDGVRAPVWIGGGGSESDTPYRADMRRWRGIVPRRPTPGVAHTSTGQMRCPGGMVRQHIARQASGGTSQQDGDEGEGEQWMCVPGHQDSLQ
jgi:hypothetical protein